MLAHNFCFYHHDPETLDVLPRWAHETLSNHQDDNRKTVYAWERLYRGKSGDVLWDAAQKSLLVHGELHNNVRMTWGKAFLNWTPDPQSALDLMIDTDHDHHVYVFEKASRPGGRTASISNSRFAFDAGVQYFTVLDDRLARFVRSWQMVAFNDPLDVPFDAVFIHESPIR